jgi:DeoR/GlpR family transcriptional regulator of sugar metabolism
VDHSKFAKNGLHQLAPLTAFDLVIVDSATPEEELTALRTRGVPLQVAGA